MFHMDVEFVKERVKFFSILFVRLREEMKLAKVLSDFANIRIHIFKSIIRYFLYMRFI